MIKGENIKDKFKKKYRLVLEEIDSSLSEVKEKEVGDLISEIINAEKVFVIGAGRMRIMLSSFCMRLNHLGLSSYIVGSITCPPISSKDLLLVASSSGSTASNLAMVKKARNYKARIFTITADPASPIANLSSKILYLKGPSSINDSSKNIVFSRQPMKALFEQSLLILLDVVILMLIEKTRNSIDDMSSRHANLE